MFMVFICVFLNVFIYYLYTVYHHNKAVHLCSSKIASKNVTFVNVADFDDIRQLFIDLWTNHFCHNIYDKILHGLVALLRWYVVYWWILIDVTFGVKML